nr:type II and III secretion system protein [Escherichia coli]
MIFIVYTLYLFLQPVIALRTGTAFIRMMSLLLSKDGNSYIEMPYTKLRSLSQKVNLKEGQSLVVTGFDQNNTTTSKAGTFTPANPLFGGSQTGKNERSTLVIIITPTFPSGGNNG